MSPIFTFFGCTKGYAGEIEEMRQLSGGDGASLIINKYCSIPLMARACIP